MQMNVHVGLHILADECTCRHVDLHMHTLTIFLSPSKGTETPKKRCGSEPVQQSPLKHFRFDGEIFDMQEYYMLQVIL